MGSNIDTRLLPSKGQPIVYIDETEKCMNENECKYVYECIDGKTPVTPLYVDKTNGICVEMYDTDEEDDEINDMYVTYENFDYDASSLEYETGDMGTPDEDLVDSPLIFEVEDQIETGVIAGIYLNNYVCAENIKGTSVTEAPVPWVPRPSKSALNPIYGKLSNDGYLGHRGPHFGHSMNQSESMGTSVHTSSTEALASLDLSACSDSKGTSAHTSSTEVPPSLDPSQCSETVGTSVHTSSTKALASLDLSACSDPGDTSALKSSTEVPTSLDLSERSLTGDTSAHTLATEAPLLAQCVSMGTSEPSSDKCGTHAIPYEFFLENVENPYERLMTTRYWRDTKLQRGLQNWSILTNNIHYPNTDSIKPVMYSTLNRESRADKFHNSFKLIDNVGMIENFQATNVVPPEDLDRFDNIDIDIMPTKHFNDNTDLSTTYMGKHGITRDTKFEPDLTLPLSQNCRITGKILNGKPIRTLFDTGATKSYLSIHYYNENIDELGGLQKYVTQCKAVVVGNGQHIPILFCIPILVEFDKHFFEIFTLVTPISQTLDLIFGIKNMYECEGNIQTRNSTFGFKNRSVPLFPIEDITVPQNASLDFKVEAPFCSDISGFGITKLLTKGGISTMKCKYTSNHTVINVTNTMLAPLHLRRNHSIGFLDIRSMGYYMVEMHTLKDKLSDNYHFEKLDDICEAFNNTMETSIPRPECSKEDPYPWLKDSDWRKTATDKEIFDRCIDLSQSLLDDNEKKELMDICYTHREAFSLRDEIGECPNIKVKIDLSDKTPFFVRPFQISEDDKPCMDWNMERLVHLGVLTKKSTSHTSPVMLISRKLTSDKRPVVDFRLLNSRVVRRNTSTPLMRDIISTLGKAKMEVLSCIDFKDAYHSLHLDEESKEFCGIMPYFGSPCYRFERVPQGLSISPAMWIEYVNILLEQITNREKYIAIMDDMLFHSLKVGHWDMVINLLETSISHGLRMSPKKCQFFMKALIYMGNTFRIEGAGVVIEALKTRTEAIQKFEAPNTAKKCKRFCGMVNYLSMFCPNLQQILSPIYKLTCKGTPFKWTNFHQIAFDKVKELLISPPILSLPNKIGRFILYTDTSKTHAGSALWQVQEGTPRLLGYSSKSLPTAAQNYSITELEMKGMLTGIMIWAYVLGRKEFDCAVDHQAVVQILKSKNEPATNRIMRLLEELSKFNFKLYYVKGKDMHLSDFLSRGDIRDTEDPKCLIPISITMNDLNALEISNFNATETVLNLLDCDATLQVMTRNKSAKAQIKVPAIFGKDKQLDPHVKPEKQKRVRQIGDQVIKPPPSPIQMPDTPLPPMASKDNTVEIPLNERAKIKDPLRQSRWTPQPRSNPNIDLDEDKGIENIKIRHKAPDKRQFLIPPALSEGVKDKEIDHKFLPTQADIDKLLFRIKTKILRHTHLHQDLKDIQGHYLKSPHFQGIYQLKWKNKTPSQKRKAQQIHNEADNYFILDSLLFRIYKDKHNQLETQLCIPTSLVDTILYWYHSSTLGAHMGITKCLTTISERYYIPELARHVRAYITGCHVCQMFKNNNTAKKHLNARVNIDTPPLTKISMDIKTMPESKEGYKFILVLICELSNFLIVSPMQNTKAETACKCLKDNLIGYFGVPTQIITDQDPAFMSSIIQYMFQQFQIQLITVGPTNHQSLKAEHGIKSLSSILMKHLANLGQNWPDFLYLSMLSYNSYASPNLNDYSPFELALGRKANLIPALEIKPEIKVTQTFKQTYEKMKAELSYMRENLQKFKNDRLNKENQTRTENSFTEGQLVYLYQPKGAHLQTGSTKIKCDFVGPLVIYKAISHSQFILMSMDGMIYPHLIEETRIKPGYVNTSNGSVSTLADLQKALRSITTV